MGTMTGVDARDVPSPMKRFVAILLLTGALVFAGVGTCCLGQGIGTGDPEGLGIGLSLSFWSFGFAVILISIWRRRR